ncbi:hypothetical protein PR202_ga09321 [Eleusine coracana subsp. coracana]|uniref:Uncharacterized protein n=1 Tax=Eleusine coracana subsp. coracana TaxID=191504 RepID=A0AAV5C4R5_ELECO|nr:hypothetical protein PR202_ga09321 [Eleusine coracana subsp. coracana]
MAARKQAGGVVGGGGATPWRRRRRPRRRACSEEVNKELSRLRTRRRSRYGDDVAAAQPGGSFAAEEATICAYRDHWAPAITSEEHGKNAGRAKQVKPESDFTISSWGHLQGPESF